MRLDQRTDTQARRLTTIGERAPPERRCRNGAAVRLRYWLGECVARRLTNPPLYRHRLTSATAFGSAGKRPARERRPISGTSVPRARTRAGRG